MLDVFSDYHQAYQVAQAEANKYTRPMAIERATEYGRQVYRVKWIPIDPRQRFGWELRAEVVQPEVARG